MIYIRDEKKRASTITITTCAYLGFRDLGEAITRFEDIHAISPTREDVVVGYITDAMTVCRQYNVSLPVLDYPDELMPFYGRTMWDVESLRELIENEVTGIFVKPRDGMKRTVGKVIRTPTDYCGMSFENDIAMKCAEIVDIVSEWRCFVRYGEILTAKHYKGDPFVAPDRGFVEEVIEAYASAPAAYAIDVGVLRDRDSNGKNKNIVIEVNDGYSLGTYGISPVPYAKLLSARWSQLMGVVDPHR